jgi:hypothetical protein
MMSRHASAGWFSTLRRDARLFVLVASLMLFAHALQPLAMANAAGLDGSAICSMSGEGDASGTLPAGDDCPNCIGGPCAGLAMPQKLAADWHAAYRAPRSQPVAVSLFQTSVAPQHLDDPPPAIRAPPAFA